MAKPKLISMNIDGNPVTLIDDNGKYYVDLQPVINGTGLSWKRQFAKLRANSGSYDRRDFVSNLDNVYHCIALDDLAAFLGTVNPASVAPAIWQKLQYYKTGWLCQLEEHLAPKVLTCSADLGDILRTIGFSDALLARMGMLDA